MGVALPVGRVDSDLAHLVPPRVSSSEGGTAEVAIFVGSSKSPLRPRRVRLSSRGRGVTPPPSRRGSQCHFGRMGRRYQWKRVRGFPGDRSSIAIARSSDGLRAGPTFSVRARRASTGALVSSPSASCEHPRVRALRRRHRPGSRRGMLLRVQRTRARHPGSPRHPDRPGARVATPLGLGQASENETRSKGAHRIDFTTERCASSGALIICRAS